MLDLGSGGGLDCFLAARQVGPTGKIIGVDMTPEMISKARDNADRVSATNVEFRLGEIERLPIADRSVDIVVSNCVKSSVFREAFRALRAGGRLAISDIVASAAIPEAVRTDPLFIAGCIGGAPAVEELRAQLLAAGFVDVSIDVRPESKTFIKDWSPGSGAEGYVAAAQIRAVRPSGEGCCATAKTSSSSCC